MYCCARGGVAVDMPRMAPEWQVSRWFNSPPLTLAGLRRRVVVVYAFQILCPACAVQALPQMQRLQQAFSDEDLTVIGLHTVLQHDPKQSPLALQAFLKEYGYTFPVGVDAYNEGASRPQTMQTYAVQGTPTLLLVDAQGRLRKQHFGSVDDLALGVALGGLLEEARRDPFWHN